LDRNNRSAAIYRRCQNAEVADRLRASPFTVDGRLRRVFAKLSVSTRVELTAEYARLARR
jgi:DNA-binding CsgD family transcriptional regulator